MFDPSRLQDARTDAIIRNDDPAEAGHPMERIPTDEHCHIWKGRPNTNLMLEKNGVVGTQPGDAARGLQNPQPVAVRRAEPLGWTIR